MAELPESLGELAAFVERLIDEKPGLGSAQGTAGGSGTGPPGPPGPGIVVHDDVQFFAGSIAASGTADTAFDYASPAVVAFLTRIRTDRAARVRVYTDAAHRTADRARPVSTDPINDHGCLLEVVTTAGVLDLKLSPGVIARAPSGTSLPVIVDNLDTVNALTGVWMTWFGGT